MRRIAILGNDNDYSLASLVGVIKDDVTIITAKESSKFAQKAKMLNLNIKKDVLVKELNEYDLLIVYDYELPKGVVADTILLHSSLLPSFNTVSPIRDAFFAGVKVSGVTVYNLIKDKIYAQFPVFIDNNTHFDEFEENMHRTENLVFPLAVKSILENKVFSFSDLMGGGNPSCSGNCGSCGGCGGN